MCCPHQIQDTLDSKVHFWEEQLQQETDSLLLTQSSLTNDASLLKLHVAWDSLSNYQRYEAVKQFSYRLLNVKVLHSIAASIKTYFPDRKIVISADSPILDSYEEDDYGDFRQACLNEDGSICLTIFFPYNMNPSNRKIPHFYIRTTITPKTLQGKLEEMLGEDEGTVFLLNQDGTVLAGCREKAGGGHRFRSGSRFSSGENPHSRRGKKAFTPPGMVLLPAGCFPAWESGWFTVIPIRWWKSRSVFPDFQCGADHSGSGSSGRLCFLCGKILCKTPRSDTPGHGG